MNKSNFKRRLKPIIKECISEVLLEEGILSNVISEVVRGLAPLNHQPSLRPIHEEKDRRKQLQEKELEAQKIEIERERLRRLKEQKRKLLDAAGFGTNVFEGVEPLTSKGKPSEGSHADASTSALSGVDPQDPGVDITGIMALGGSNWKKMI